MSLQLGNERHDILVVGIKQAAIYVLYMVNLKLPSNVLNHILLLLWGRGSKLCIYLLHSVVKILKYLVMCSLEVGGSWNNMPIITLCRRFEIGLSSILLRLITIIPLKFSLWIQNFHDDEVDDNDTIQANIHFPLCLQY